MKNESAKAKKSQKTDTEKDVSTSDEQTTTAVAADTSVADTNGQVETADNKTEVVYMLTKETAEFNEGNAAEVLSELGKDFSQKQLDQMISGELVLPSGNYLFSTDKSKLENIVTDKGWNVPKPEQTVEYDEPQEISSAGIDEVDFSSELPETNPFQSEDATQNESLDVSDPNEPIYDLFRNDAEFAKALNKKETALIAGMSAGKKLQASLSAGDTKLFDTIVAKYESYNLPPKDEEQEPLDNFRTAEAMEVIKSDEQRAELLKPLTDEEKADYKRLNKDFKKAKDNFDNAPFLMMDIASEIRSKNLFREEFTSIKDWAEAQGITREYAQNLAQWGDFRKVLAETGESSLQLAGTVNANKQWAQDTNKIAEQLGVKPSEFDVMKPIIEAVSSVISEVATDAQGNLNSVAPRIFSAANDKIPEIIHTGSIEIGGEQMLIEDALKLGEDVITEGIKTQIVEAVATGIKAQKQEIVDYIKDSKERRTKAHEAQETPSTNGKEVFTGVVPVYSAQCTGHPDVKDNYVIIVFNAGFQLKCLCKYQMLTTSGESFVCIESDGLQVQHD